MRGPNAESALIASAKLVDDLLSLAQPDWVPPRLVRIEGACETSFGVGIAIALRDRRLWRPVAAASVAFGLLFGGSEGFAHAFAQGPARSCSFLETLADPTHPEQASTLPTPSSGASGTPLQHRNSA